MDWPLEVELEVDLEALIDLLVGLELELELELEALINLLVDLAQAELELSKQLMDWIEVALSIIPTFFELISY